VGLGLTICRGIVEAHGGRITAQSRPNGGVAFRVALPLADKPPEIPADDG
jgi:two-component system sensor histidine kinase KdpD